MLALAFLAVASLPAAFALLFCYDEIARPGRLRLVRVA